MDITDEEQHNIEIHENLNFWKKKLILQKIYNEFYKAILDEIRFDINGSIIELGSGIGNLKSVLPSCICTDIFPNPWIDQVENAYSLSFADQSLSNIILFDVFHHLEFPGTALEEFRRALKPGGRVIIFDPDISLLGSIVYGIFHHEPVSFFKKINWFAPESFNINNAQYYAAQGNANRIFKASLYEKQLKDWKKLKVKPLSSISYICTGGYRGKKIIPDSLYPYTKYLEKTLDRFPFLFSTRLLTVLEKI
jgi:SAM-dependent methyltransferase